MREVSFLPQMEPLIEDSDADVVQEYLRSGGWITEFEKTREFEREICAVTGAKYCVAAPSGTAALFLALSACDVRSGDEVIVPDLTMAATASSVILAGATVKFADVEPATMCLDLDAAFEKITPSTKAVVFVSLNGRASHGLKMFVERCSERQVTVIEDAAQSFGSLIDGQHLGTIGKCGCFSFSSQKIVTTGQGGAVITNDEATHTRIRYLRDFGRESGGSDHYLTVGWNFKYTDLQAALGLAQLKRLPQMLARKKRQFELYREMLGSLEGLAVPPTPLESVSPWFNDILVTQGRRDSLAAYLRKNGVGSRPFYPPLHSEPAFRVDQRFPVAERISAAGLWLPSSLKLTDEEIVKVCGLITQFLTRG